MELVGTRRAAAGGRDRNRTVDLLRAPRDPQTQTLNTYRHAQVDKHVLVYELGVRYRDLLTLDPTLPLPFPAAILIREQALVVNLENVRMIICANQCYILSVPSVSGILRVLL